MFQLASLSTNPGNARIQVICPQTPSGLLDVSDGLRMSLPPLAVTGPGGGGGGAMSSTEAALNLLVLSSAEMLRQTIKYAAIKCRRYVCRLCKFIQTLQFLNSTNMIY